MSLLTRPGSPSSNQLLRRIIEDPVSAATIRSLPAEPLARLIDHVGLEDAGEIISLATTDQLLGVFDSDLWRRERGGEEGTFSPERFLLWLEVLLEAGEKALVTRLSELPEELVISAFYAHVLVLNLDDLSETQLSWNEEAVDLADKALSDCLGHELDEYYIIARRDNGWDTLLTTIIALYERAPDFLNRILSRCCYASSEYIEENGGLYDVLTAEEMLTSDAAADRADRRAGQGYVAPSDAAALFRLAMSREPEELLTLSEPDPITRAYFRELDSKAPSKSKKITGASSSSFGNKEAPDEPENRTSSRRLHSLLESAGILGDAPLVPLLAEPEAAICKTGRFRALLNALGESDPDGRERRVQLLIYLANVVEAFFGSSEEPIRPMDAMQAVFDICDIALTYFDEMAPKGGAPASPDSKGRGVSPVALFLAGFQILSRRHKLDSMSALQNAVREALRSEEGAERPIVGKRSRAKREK